MEGVDKLTDKYHDKVYDRLPAVSIGRKKQQARAFADARDQRGPTGHRHHQRHTDDVSMSSYGANPRAEGDRGARSDEQSYEDGRGLDEMRGQQMKVGGDGLDVGHGPGLVLTSGRPIQRRRREDTTQAEQDALTTHADDRPGPLDAAARTRGAGSGSGRAQGHETSSTGLPRRLAGR